MYYSEAGQLEPNLVGELYERGFTLVDTTSSDELLSEIEQLSGQIHRGFVDGYPRHVFS